MVPLDPAFLARPIAHRGLHDAAAGRPENSCAAILAAIEAGYGIEIDIQPCANGTPMLFHDYALDRLTDAVGSIRSLPCAELQALKLSGTNEGIPTLAEALDLVAGRVPLVIEIKDQDGQLGPTVGALEAQVGAVLRGCAGPVAVISFNPNSVRVMQEHAPDVGQRACDRRLSESGLAAHPPRPARAPRTYPRYGSRGCQLCQPQPQASRCHALAGHLGTRAAGAHLDRALRGRGVCRRARRGPDHL